MPCTTMFHLPRPLLALFAILALLSFTACQSTPVTSGGKPVVNEALATAIRAVDVAEKAIVIATDGMTAGYEAGIIPASALQSFQSTIAPRVRAAFATAKVAIKTAEAAQGGTPMTLLMTVVLELQSEVASLQGWYTSNALVVQGGAK